MKNSSTTKRMLAVALSIVLLLGLAMGSTAASREESVDFSESTTFALDELFVTDEGLVIEVEEVLDPEIDETPDFEIDETPSTETDETPDPEIDETPAPEPEVDEVDLPQDSPIAIAFEEGNSLLAGTGRLATVALDLDELGAWSSNDESVLRVENTQADFGVDSVWLIGVDEGEAVLQLELPDGIVFEQSITVLPRPDFFPRPESFLATPHQVQATAGASAVITLSNLPDDGTFADPLVFDWVSSDQTVAILSSEMTRGGQYNTVIRGLAEGTAVITLLLMAQPADEDADITVGYYSIEVVVSAPEIDELDPPDNGFWSEFTTALVEPPEMISPMLCPTRVTGVWIGARAANNRRPSLPNGRPRPFTIFYDCPTHGDRTVLLTANVTPSDANDRTVRWSSRRVLDSHNVNPPALSSTTANPITVRPTLTTPHTNRRVAPPGRFIREITVTTNDGDFTDRLIVIGVSRVNPAWNYIALRRVDVFSGPYANQPNYFPRVAQIPAGTQVSVRGQYGADWHYITWGDGNWGYVRLRTYGNFIRVATAAQRRTIVVDPGHGGTDSGSLGPGGRRESADNLRMSLEVRRVLQAAGHNVVMTRTTDVARTHQQRIDTSNNANAHIFVSIHRNWSSYTGSNGVCTHIRTNAPNLAINAANNILDEVVNAGGLRRRQVFFTNFPQLQTRAPAVLVEVGFISNVADNRAFDQNFHAYAHAIAQGTIRTLGIGVI